MEHPKNRFKAALKRGERQIGFWNTIPDPSVVEALATLSFDWLLIDTEHTPVDVPQVMSLLQAAAPYDVTTIVRPVANDTALIKRYLDIGAQTLGITIHDHLIVGKGETYSFRGAGLL